MSELDPGLYEDLVSEALRAQIDRVDSSLVDLRTLDASDSHEALARYLVPIVARALDEVGGSDDQRVMRQAAVVNSLIDSLRAHSRVSVLPTDRLESPPSELLSVREQSVPYGSSPAVIRPSIPLTRSALLVNGRGQPRIGNELPKEIGSANSADLICAFLKWHGYRIVQPALRSLRERGGRVRVLTTTFLGSTDRRVIDDLCAMGAEVKISYDTSSTRLHAKAWLFRRPSVTTAYVGSSNLSKTALQDGLEWNVRLTDAEHPHLIEAFGAAFDDYWEDGSFEPYDPQRDAARFDAAISSELGGGQGSWESIAPIDVTPYPYQREVLERLDADRTIHGRWHSLVVMATGTGKTVVAAMDYRQLRERQGVDRLLFIAHREEILTQSLRTFRQVLRDGSHGELLVGGRRPNRWTHVYASVQSLAGVDLSALSPDHFDMVIVDEFHHAEAASYDRILRYFRPRVLLGLTATPERADGGDVTRWFGGRIAVEMRLWEALERSILCPFQYFGVADNTDLRTLEWRRGAYDVAALSRTYEADRHRVAIVLETIRERVADPLRMRALGFCVSVEHAKFMANEFNAAGIPSLAVTGDTAADDRRDAIAALRERRVNVLFSVDLFNEGFDLPDIDTVMLLRPTESATVFLQQIGRGLRLAEDKACLTILDFIGQQHRAFRFDLRLGALTGTGRSKVQQNIEAGFPDLPPGCHIDLDPVAREIILGNVRQAISRPWRELVGQLHAQGDPSLSQFLADQGLSLDDLYRTDDKGWTNLRVAAGKLGAFGAQRANFVRGIRRMLHVDDPRRLAALRMLVRDGLQGGGLSESDRRMRAMLFFDLMGPDADPAEMATIFGAVPSSAFADEMLQVVDLLEDRLERVTYPLAGDRVPLSVHAHYTRDEALAGFGHLKPSTVREGVAWLPTEAADLFFVTLNKSERDFSPTTMYRDRAISSRLFQWESQSRTSAESPTGQRYINHEANGSSVHLFVRGDKRNDLSLSSPYFYAGPAHYVRHRGDRPIEFVWELERDLPADILHEARALAA